MSKRRQPLIDMTQPNIGLLYVVAMVAGCAVILSLIGFLMKRTGVSLRPLYWFVGFLLLILLPQLAGHLLNNSMPGAPSQSAKLSDGVTAKTSTKDYTNAKEFFGTKSAGILVIDGRATASGLLHAADDPKFFILSGGETLLIERFANSVQAENAVHKFLQQSRLADRARVDRAGGFSAQRGPADFVYARAFGNLFTAWSGPSPAAIAQVQSAAGLAAAPDEVRSHADPIRGEWLDGVIKNASASWTGLAVIVTALLAYILLVAAYFFKGLAWAIRADPRPSANILSASELRERLLAINSLDVPFRLESGKNENELVAGCRYADAKWLDHARAHGMRRLHRVILEFDEFKRKIRATDFTTVFDWSAGGTGATLNWKFTTGIVLFQYEHQRVFGLQLDENGHFKPSLSFSYTFNLQEIKKPLTAAVTDAGWTWQPVAWNAPAWLKWLTE